MPIGLYYTRQACRQGRWDMCIRSAAEVHLGLPCPPIMVRPLRSIICKNQAREEISIFDHHSDFACRLIFKRGGQNCPFDVYNLIVVMVTRMFVC